MVRGAWQATVRKRVTHDLANKQQLQHVLLWKSNCGQVHVILKGLLRTPGLPW